MNHRRVLPVLSLSALSFSIAQTATVPAISQMAESLSATRTEILWTHSAYLVSAAICTPIVGRLGDLLGKRRMLVIALAFFGAGSLMAGFADRFEVVIAGRLIQGVGGGIFPLCFGIVRDGFPPHRISASIAIIAGVLGLASGLGLLIGGLLLDYVGWEWIFWLGAATAALSAGLVILRVPSAPPTSPGRIDLYGAAFLIGGLAALMLGLTTIGSWGLLDPRTIALLTAGVAILTLMAKFEAGVPDPLIDIASLRTRPVLMTNLATLMVGFTLFGSFVLISQLAQSPGFGLGLSATGAGLVMIPGCFAMLGASGLVVPLTLRFGRTTPLFTGSMLTAVGLLLVIVAGESVTAMVIWTVLALAGMGLSLATIPNLIVEAVGPLRTGEATGINVLVRSIGSALGSQVTATILVGTTAVSAASAGPIRESLAACAALALTTAVVGLKIPLPGRPGD